ncbi:uncharacterized protein LOC143257927 [Tachypleus tridentatus]|uniref:uncharacterized protein LOC143257927 n=1 Tax=Tachypleus tridentatus TaxID=6853 RepID=UPI003FD5203B
MELLEKPTSPVFLKVQILKSLSEFCIGCNENKELVKTYGRLQALVNAIDDVGHPNNWACYSLSVIIAGNLQAKTVILMQRKFWNIFISFNWLIFPTLVSVVLGTCFGHTSVISEIQVMVAALLMLSVVVGVPSYIVALREIKTYTKEIKERSTSRIRNASYTHQRSVNDIKNTESGNGSATSESDN